MLRIDSSESHSAGIVYRFHRDRRSMSWDYEAWMFIPIHLLLLSLFYCMYSIRRCLAEENAWMYELIVVVIFGGKVQYHYTNLKYQYQDSFDIHIHTDDNTR